MFFNGFNELTNMFIFKFGMIMHRMATLSHVLASTVLSCFQRPTKQVADDNASLKAKQGVALGRSRQLDVD